MVRALASHQCGSGSNRRFDTIIGSLLQKFFSRYSGFPLSLKTNTSKFQFDLKRTDTFKRVDIRTAKGFVGNEITIYFCKVAVEIHIFFYYHNYSRGFNYFTYLP